MVFYTFPQQEEMARLKQSIAGLKDDGEGGESEMSERDQLIARQYDADKEKLHKIRLLLVGKHNCLCTV